ncbi:MAG: c-type cytochrome biogenesis protein CcmI [Sulfuricellaceae bacterium]
MTAFIIAATLLTLAVLALLVYPLLRRKATHSASRRQLNAAIYRDQLSELERDFADGSLSAGDYANDREELQRRLLEDANDAETPAAANVGGKPTALTLAIALPIAAALLYVWLGSPNAIDHAAAQHNTGMVDLERMVAGLAAKQEKNPDDFEGWIMLGRSYKAFGRFDKAVKALEHALPVIEKDAALLAIYADALAAQAGGKLEGKPRQIIEQALKLDPESNMALDLAGSAAYDRKDFAAAVEYWERLKKLLPPGSENAQSLAAGIADARAQMAGVKK